MLLRDSDDEKGERKAQCILAFLLLNHPLFTLKGPVKDHSDKTENAKGKNKRD
jgi:hypothetical protein